MKNFFKLSINFFFLFIMSFTLYAHSGGTDSNGGHHDRKNGGYHYHHGHGPHQHDNGCPYEDGPQGGGISFFWYLVMGGVSIIGYNLYQQKMKK